MGRAWKLHDNVNTDEIIPGRYNMTTDRAALAEHCLCEVRPDFPGGVRPGDVLVGGRNFGCGSSREHAPIAIQASGVSAVVAPSFARIFYRNAVNIGLPVLTCADAGRIEEGDTLDVDAAAGIIRNRTRGEEYRAEPLPPFVSRIAEAGGILEFIRRYGWEGVA
ncbi:MAG TPA: 3-isopropylmalate dehydratase small subunit [Chloroflexota bacterium]|nr:3-isopropylmalate dehydratase small subunit [Chloroflexota bacterium]